MKKPLYFSFVLLFFFAGSCFAQHVSSADTVRTIEIIRGKNLRERSIDSVNKLETIAGDVVLRERLTKFSCDSAIINRKENTIEAFGNVHINDDDSVHTYSQYLKYFGNQRLAHLTKDVKLTDKKGVLLTQDLEYDLSTGIGTYHTGGKVINASTVLTSKDGVYYSETKDVYFRHNVDLVDPKYKIQADSLLYNTQSQVVTFIGPTNIKSRQANIFTTEGTYDLKNGNAFFGTRSLVTDSSRRIYQADSLAIDENAGLAELKGNAVIKDSANGVIVIANHIYLNNKNSSFLAVNKPVMIIEQAKDSIYIAADTLFSGFTTALSQSAPAEKKDTVKAELAPGNISTGSFAEGVSTKSFAEALELVTNPKPALSKSPKQDTLKMSAGTGKSGDSLGINSFKKDSARLDTLQTGERLPPATGDDSIKKRPAIKPPTGADTFSLQKDSSQKRQDTFARSLNGLPVRDSLTLSLNEKNAVVPDTVKGTKIVNLTKNDTATRYFLAFHHVKIFNDSLQSVCDSLFFSAKDSIFRLFHDPVVWSGQSQVSGDTIYLFTANKKPEHLYVFNNGLVVNKSYKEFYNQVAGKTINGYFKDGSIDYARVKGQQAESIYYVQDRDSAFVGMNNSTGDVIDMFFLKGALNKVKFISDVEGTMYPMKQIPEDKKFLKNFQWLDKRRPKNKLELFE